MNDELTESLEKYLLAIYEIVKINQAARVKDVSNYLKIGGPATSEAVKNLAKKKFINYVPYGIITLTEKGLKKAKLKIERHNTISNFLEKVLLIPSSNIEETTKQVEYSMPTDVLNKFIKFLEFMETCSCKEPKWVKSYKHFINNGELQDKCKHCINNNKDHIECNCKCC